MEWINLCSLLWLHFDISWPFFFHPLDFVKRMCNLMSFVPCQNKLVPMHLGMVSLIWKGRTMKGNLRFQYRLFLWMQWNQWEWVIPVVSSILRIGPSPPLIRSYHHAFNLVNWRKTLLVLATACKIYIIMEFCFDVVGFKE
jgi:hypothetical protein